MNDFMYLVTMTYEALEAANEEQRFCQELRVKYKIPSGELVPVASLQSGDAFRLGEMAGRTTERWERVKRIAVLQNVSIYSLISTVKSMSRWNLRHDLYGKVVKVRTEGDVARMRRFMNLQKNEENRYYKSTRRVKAWCKGRKVA